MLYDDFQNENSHYTCKGSVFRQNDIIIFRQNDRKTWEDRMTERQKNDRMYIINALLLSYNLFFGYSVLFTSNLFIHQLTNTPYHQ